LKPEVREVVEVIDVRGDTEKIVQSMKAVYPDLVITSGNQKVVIKGEESRVREGIELAKKLEIQVVEEPRVREIVRLKGLEAQSLKEAISGINEVNIAVIKQTNSLVIQGSKSKVEEIKRLIEALDVEPGKEVKQVVEAIEVRGDVSQIQSTIKAVYPEIVSSISGRYIVIRGEDSKVSEAKRLILDIDKPQVKPEV
ncbi:MAG: hypothetical protein H5T71_07915, partial [Chloroflexi bacterium]|nr:hypothetical protein [Chloroflexota bacterium]